ncbi:hypothetical protein G7Z17_g4281 [Cylindrodendrum hubeiense]|uniref:EF-hand domain-containing protein n=1 Tax=Cylindrodendrum hubeiense TaxID=595255 RepID=A0A9P5HE72_9HYPO|nr:hypothetical protein G7Z17_g4281 [Cylindrodendrum hubeiense]
MFLYFGTTADSWAVGNDHFSLAQNLPAPIQQLWDRLAGVFDSPSMAGTMISWMATAPDGAYAVMTKGGELLCSRPDLLAAAQPPSAVEHIALSPLGGWFVCFTDGTVQVSPPAGFSQACYSLLGPYLDWRCTARQYSPVCSVFFGAGEAVIVRTDRGLVSAMLPPSLQTSLQLFLDESSIVNKRFTSASASASTPADESVLHSFVGPIEFKARPISSPPIQEPVAAPSIPSGCWSTPRPEIPAAARSRYEKQFQDQCGGKSYLTGIEAAGVFFESGLGKSDLSRIWEETDRDRNGRFDKDEFVEAMCRLLLFSGIIKQQLLRQTARKRSTIRLRQFLRHIPHLKITHRHPTNPGYLPLIQFQYIQARQLSITSIPSILSALNTLNPFCRHRLVSLQSKR